MAEYAIRFWALLNSAYRLQASRQSKMVEAIVMALAEPSARQNYLNKLSELSDGIMPGDKANDYSGLETLKGHMGTKNAR